MPHLAFYLTLALVAGIAAGVLSDLSTHSLAAIAGAGGWLVSAAAFVRRWPRVQLIGTTSAVLAIGSMLGAHAVDRAWHPPLRTLLEQRIGGFAIDGADEGRLDEPMIVEGRLRSDASMTPSGAVLALAVERVWLGPCPEPAAGGVSLGVSGALQSAYVAQWTAGRVIRAPALLRRPARYLNVGVPDQERAMARRGVSLVGTIKSAALVDVIARGAWWDEMAAAVRARTREAIHRHVAPLDARSAAIATAILIGDRAALDVDLERRLQEAGTYHVIAISGGNIAILAGLVLATFSWLGWRGRIGALAAIGVLTAYAFVAAGGASVVRATLMAVIYLAARVIDQRTAAANAIALSAAILLLADPLATLDVAFWLTFGAAGAILIGVSRVRLPQHRWWSAAPLLLLASACAELALAPIGALVFQRVTLAGLPLNFIAIPSMTVVQIAAMGLVPADVVGLSWLAQRLAWAVHVAALGLTRSTQLLDVAPWLTWRVPSPSMAMIVAYYATIAVAIALPSTHATWRQPRVVKRVAAAVSAGLFLWIIVAPAARVRAMGDGRLHLTLIDVGQGDAMLVTFPNGRTLIVDTGGITTRGAFDVGDRVVGPALRARGLVRLDYLAVTHGDPDHAGGARSLTRDFEPREIWWGVPVAQDEPTALVRAEADARRTAWRTLQRGDRLEIGGVELRVHHPPPPDWERQKVRNNDSLVMELRFGEVSMLLTGDIGREVEEALLPTLDLLPIVVMKVPHHGSGTSSSVQWVQQTHPAIALIGVGRGNSYGHPLPYVLERYHTVGAHIFRTDRDGEVEVTTDGRSVQVDAYTGEKLNTKMR